MGLIVALLPLARFNGEVIDPMLLLRALPFLVSLPLIQIFCVATIERKRTQVMSCAERGGIAMLLVLASAVILFVGSIFPEPEPLCPKPKPICEVCQKTNTKPEQTTTNPAATTG